MAGGAGQFWPDQWTRFVAMVPEEERGDLIKAYNKRLFCGDLMVETRYARAWASMGECACLDGKRWWRAATARRITRAPSRGWKTTIS